MTRDPWPVIRVAVAHFPPATAAIPDIRAHTVRTLAEWSFDPDAVELAELIVAEVASNAVKVSRPTDLVAVRLAATRGHVLVEVWDSDGTAPVAGNPGEDAESGRGLLLVDGLTSRWSWYRVRTGGKVVWAEFPGECLSAPRPPASVLPGPRRTPATVPEPFAPVVYRTDPKTLLRVVDALRGLDDWHQPRPAVALSER